MKETSDYGEGYDEEGYVKEYPFFTAKVTDKIEYKPGCWNGVKVSVYQHNSKDAEPQLLGIYDRNYSTNFNDFAWTRVGDRYFALYSPNYTCTRVMEIFPGQGFKDIGGEDSDGCGFCPTDLYIPTLRQYVNEQYHVGPGYKIQDWSKLLEYFPPGTYKTEMSKSKGRQKLRYPDGKDIRAYTNQTEEILGRTRDKYKWVWGPERDYEGGFVVLPPKHGFVAGCVWGDDSSWKIQYLDVSRIAEGIIKRDDRFGYIELPDGLELKDAIDLQDLDESDGRITITINLQFDETSGDVYVWDEDLWTKMVSGRKRVEEREKKFRDSAFWNDQEEELKQRWAEQGERITAEVLASGGEIK